MKERKPKERLQAFSTRMEQVQVLKLLLGHSRESHALAAQRCRCGTRTLQQWVYGERAMPPLAMEILAMSMLLSQQWPSTLDAHQWVRDEFLSLI